VNSKKGVGCWVNKDSRENNRLKIIEDKKYSFMGNVEASLIGPLKGNMPYRDKICMKMPYFHTWLWPVGHGSLYENSYQLSAFSLKRKLR